MHTILIVVDGDGYKRCQNCLPGDEYRLIPCADGDKALKQFDGADVHIAAAIVLWKLGGPIPGSQLIQQIHEKSPKTMIIAVDDQCNWDVNRRAKALGANLVLHWSSVSGDLPQLLNEHLNPPPPPENLERVRRIPGVIGESPAWLKVLGRLANLLPVSRTVVPPACENNRGQQEEVLRARDNITVVLMTGDSGTGKDVVTHLIRQLVARTNDPYVYVNLAALSETLFENELFGHEQGSYTGANKVEKGRFELASGGLLVIDEIGALPLSLQPKLLHVLEGKKFERVGGREKISFSGWVVCATNRPLLADVNANHFRFDLYMRIARNPIHLPRLRERANDWRLLLTHFIDRYSNGRVIRVAPETESMFDGYPFNGNVRELANLVEHAVKQCRGGVLRPEDFPEGLWGERPECALSSFPSGPDDVHTERPVERSIAPIRPDSSRKLVLGMTLNEAHIQLDREILSQVYDAVGGNTTAASERLHINPSTFYNRWAKAFPEQPLPKENMCVELLLTRPL